MPPTHITILDDIGAAVMDNTVGPYQDGATINLTCMSSGGKEWMEGNGRELYVIELQMKNSWHTLLRIDGRYCCPSLAASSGSFLKPLHIINGHHCLLLLFQVFHLPGWHGGRTISCLTTRSRSCRMEVLKMSCICPGLTDNICIRWVEENLIYFGRSVQLRP